jgi:hypothetical protein
VAVMVDMSVVPKAAAARFKGMPEPTDKEVEVAVLLEIA